MLVGFPLSQQENIMSKIIEFQVPVHDADTPTITKSGTIAVFQIGSEKFRFVIQHNNQFVGDLLAHYASGNVAIRSNAIKSMKNRNYKSGFTLTTREACRLCLQELVTKVGEAKVLQTLRAAKVINK